MNETQTNVAERSAGSASSNLSPIDFLVVLAKHKKMVIGLPLIAAIIAVAISLILPNIYQASTKLLPPQQPQSGAAALLSQLGGVAGAAAGVAGLKNPNDLYIGMLRSRTIADKLVQRYSLQKIYDTESFEKARKTLQANTIIVGGKDGLITIDVEGEDKKLVTQLANSYVEELVKLTKVLAVTEAAHRRLFFERQLEISKNNLADAEIRLKGGLDTRGVVSVDADSRGMVETVGRLRAQISAKEIQLGAMKAFVTTNNQEYRRAEETLQSLRAELSRLENGRPGAASELAATPAKQAGLENMKILRDVKYHQMLYELLAKQYEVARLDEAKDASIIQVLDEAVEPEKKIKPKRAIIVIFTTFIFFFIAIALAFIAESKAKLLASPARAAEWARLKSYLWKKSS